MKPNAKDHLSRPFFLHLFDRSYTFGAISNPGLSENVKND